MDADGSGIGGRDLHDRILCISFGAAAVAVREQSVAK
jgi:hypothetical protein